MQTTDTKNLPKRTRYYQSIIDMSNLNKGVNYTKLKDTYIIFLCLDDIFHKGLPVYFFENTCEHDSRLKLKDGAYKVFFNAEDCDKMESEEERLFFQFLKGQKAESEFARRIEEKIKFAKRNAAWRNQYMTWQQTIDEEKEIAFEEGKMETALATAKNFLALNKLSDEEIAQCCSLSLEDVLTLKSELISAK